MKKLADYKVCFIDNDPMDIKLEFSKRLKESLLDKWPGDRMQAVWAKSLGISAPTLSEWLNAQKMPGTEKLIEICLLLNVSVEWMSAGKGAKRPQIEEKKHDILTEEQKKVLREIIDLVTK